MICDFQQISKNSFSKILLVKTRSISRFNHMYKNYKLFAIRNVKNSKRKSRWVKHSHLHDSFCFQLFFSLYFSLLHTISFFFGTFHSIPFVSFSGGSNDRYHGQQANQCYRHGSIVVWWSFRMTWMDQFKSMPSLWNGKWWKPIL